MLKTIMVPLDGSNFAWRAMPYAIRLARPVQARLILLGAAGVDWIDPPSETEFDTMAETVRKSGVEAEPIIERVYHEDMARAICETAAERRVDLIVMSTHGRGGLGRWIYGSVADQVLRQSSVPVVLISAICEHHWPEDRPLRILVPLDGSDFAREAITSAEEMAAKLQAELLFLQVIDSAEYPYLFSDPATWKDAEPELAKARQSLEALANPIRATGQAVQVLAAFGSPAATIARIARGQGIDMIAMATHGRGGLARLVLGSVATGTLHRANVPLLLVRPAAVRQTAGDAAAEPVEVSPTTG
jgi:nucleotide-binding universal stress UspA family protein